MAPMLSSVTAVVVARENPTTINDLNMLSDALAEYFTDVEIVLVANGISAENAMDIKKFGETVTDITIVFLSEEVHDDTARLLGIDHAISDYVLFCTPLRFEIEALPKMIAAMVEGCDLVIGEPDLGISVERGIGTNLLFWIFRILFSFLNGRAYEPRPPAFRMFGRVAALYVASRSDGEVLIRARSLGRGFSVATVDVPGATNIVGRGVPLKLGLAKALRLLLTGSAMPLRVSSYLSLFGGIASLLYAVYVVLIYLFKTDVEPGWTTLSLQSAGIMLIFSIQFLFLSEYVIQILSSAPVGSRRHLVAREFRGTLSRRSARLNIVDRDGHYQIGAPSILLSKEEIE